MIRNLRNAKKYHLRQSTIQQQKSQIILKYEPKHKLLKIIIKLDSSEPVSKLPEEKYTTTLIQIYKKRKCKTVLTVKAALISLHLRHNLDKLDCPQQYSPEPRQPTSVADDNRH